MIVVVDYGAGNLRSIVNKIERIGAKTIVTSKTSIIAKADKIILPGVGHFATGMENLKRSNLIPILNKKILKEKTPILGICLGLQFFSLWSEEGNVKGLGWIKAKTKKFNFPNNNLKIPHMGWNTLKIERKSPLFNSIQRDARFYFVHSYHVCCQDSRDILATTHYGYDFVSAIQRENIYGTQFHPEKSHQAGMQIIRNFMEKI